MMSIPDRLELYRRLKIDLNTIIQQADSTAYWRNQAKYLKEGNSAMEKKLLKLEAEQYSIGLYAFALGACSVGVIWLVTKFL